MSIGDGINMEEINEISKNRHSGVRASRRCRSGLRGFERLKLRRRVVWKLDGQQLGRFQHKQQCRHQYIRFERYIVRNVGLVEQPRSFGVYAGSSDAERLQIVGSRCIRIRAGSDEEERLRLKLGQQQLRWVQPLEQVMLPFAHTGKARRGTLRPMMAT